ncbi:hypothetical protein ABZ874_24645 [Streptomyces albidoflavus]|uniref:hypothetical protein n=1 Tax=Streptomyces albidoflavus TaxID=1886 RepID=UPI0033C325F2
MAMLDSLYVLGDGGHQLVPASDLSSALRLAPKTISRAAGFFVHTGLLESGRGRWKLTERGAELCRLRREPRDDPARDYLGDQWGSMGVWFHEETRRLLANGALEDHVLAQRLSAKAKRPLERGIALVEWIEYAKLVTRHEDGFVTLPFSQRPPVDAAPETDSPEIAIDPMAGISAPYMTGLATGELLELTQSISKLLGKVPAREGF